MVEMAWTSYMEVDPAKSYIAYVGLAERKSVWSYFPLLMRSRKVAKQLNTTNGLVGFTARGEFLSKKIIQLAVFTDETTLKAFAHSGQHSNCAEKTKSSFKFLKNTTWNILGSELPPKIDEAIKKVDP